MSFDLEALRECTLVPKIVHTFGDKPYFSCEISKLSHVFLKFRSSPDEYRWSRIVEIVVCQPFEWNKKRLAIAFRVEGFSQIVPCQSISATPVDSSDVEGYCRQVGNGGDGDLDVSHLPTSEESKLQKSRLEEFIIHRIISEADIVDMQDYASKLGNLTGNIAVKHAVTNLANMRCESQVGFASSLHECGFSTRAQQRRLGASESQSQELSSQQSDLTTSQALLASQSQSSEAFSQVWESARRDEEQFAQYVANPERSGFLTRLATKTRENAVQNAMSSLRASASGKGQRSSNMIESTGLWITDDSERQRIAKEHKDTEESKKSGEDKSKPKEDKKKDAPKSSTNAPTNEKLFIESCVKQRRNLSQELAESVGDDLDAVVAEIVNAKNSAPSNISRSLSSPSLLELSQPLDDQFVFRCASKGPRRLSGKRDRE